MNATTAPINYTAAQSNRPRRGRPAQPIKWPKRPFRVEDIADRSGMSRPVVYARLSALIAAGRAKKIRREKVNHTPGRAVGIYQIGLF